MSKRVGTRIVEHGKKGRVAYLTIKRPEKLNTLDAATIADLMVAANDLHDDPALRAVVITGAGDKAFVGGADIYTMAELDSNSAEQFITSLHQAIDAVRRLPVPTVARINGYCLGAGLELAAGCDLRIAVQSAKLGMPEVRVGMPSVIEAALLPRLIGWGRTAELVLLGGMIDAEAARAIGLVEKVIPASELDRAVDTWLEAILAGGPQAIRLQKALMREWEKLPTEQAIVAGIRSFAAAFQGDEPRSMLREFIARRGK